MDRFNVNQDLGAEEQLSPGSQPRRYRELRFINETPEQFQAKVIQDATKMTRRGKSPKGDGNKDVASSWGSVSQASYSGDVNHIDSENSSNLSSPSGRSEIPIAQQETSLADPSQKAKGDLIHYFRDRLISILKEQKLLTTLRDSDLSLLLSHTLSLQDTVDHLQNWKYDVRIAMAYFAADGSRKQKQQDTTSYPDTTELFKERYDCQRTELRRDKGINVEIKVRNEKLPFHQRGAYYQFHFLTEKKEIEVRMLDKQKDRSTGKESTEPLYVDDLIFQALKFAQSSDWKTVTFKDVKNRDTLTLLNLLKTFAKTPSGDHNLRNRLVWKALYASPLSGIVLHFLKRREKAGMGQSEIATIKIIMHTQTTVDKSIELTRENEQNWQFPFPKKDRSLQFDLAFSLRPVKEAEPLDPEPLSIEKERQIYDLTQLENVAEESTFVAIKLEDDRDDSEPDTIALNEKTQPFIPVKQEAPHTSTFSLTSAMEIDSFSSQDEIGVPMITEQTTASTQMEYDPYRYNPNQAYSAPEHWLNNPNTGAFSNDHVYNYQLTDIGSHLSESGDWSDQNETESGDDLQEIRSDSSIMVHTDQQADPNSWTPTDSVLFIRKLFKMYEELLTENGYPRDTLPQPLTLEERNELDNKLRKTTFTPEQAEALNDILEDEISQGLKNREDIIDKIYFRNIYPRTKERREISDKSRRKRK